MKKAAMVLFNGPASRKALVENKCCILERHEKHILFKKKTLCFAYWSGTTDAFAIGLPRVTDRKKKARD